MKRENLKITFRIDLIRLRSGSVRECTNIFAVNNFSARLEATYDFQTFCILGLLFMSKVTWNNVAGSELQIFK